MNKSSTVKWLSSRQTANKTQSRILAPLHSPCTSLMPSVGGQGNANPSLKMGTRNIRLPPPAIFSKVLRRPLSVETPIIQKTI